MNNYTPEDIRAIAEALGVAPEVMNRHATFLDGVSVFAIYAGKAMDAPPSKIRDELLKLAAAFRRLLRWLTALGPDFGCGQPEQDSEERQPAEKRAPADAVRRELGKVLKHLGLSDWRDAIDGPSPHMLEALNYAEGVDLDQIIDLTAALGELSPFLNPGARPLSELGRTTPQEILAAVVDLERIAGEASDRVLHHGNLTVPKGRSGGDWHVNGFIKDMAKFYEVVTGECPTVWINPTGERSRFIRLLETAGAPIGLNYSAEAWRRRARTFSANGSNRSNNKFELARVTRENVAS